jgi:hypothetical protein
MALLVALVVVAARRRSAEAGYLVAVIGSQLISPIVWDHYALVLLLPVAWLVARRQWWALIVPISQAWVLLPMMPLLIYPIGFLVILTGLFIADARQPATVPATRPLAA